MAVTIAATDFARKHLPGASASRASSTHGTVTGYFISPKDYEQFERIIAASRRAYHSSELPSDLKEAVRHARMDSKHDHPKDLMDE